MIPFWKAPRNALTAFGRAVRQLFEHKSVIAHQNTIQFRESICAKCPHNANGICRLCACFIEVKVMLVTEECPDEPPRWPRLTSRPNSK